MTNIRKAKTVSLLITFALSVVLIIIGATYNSFGEQSKKVYVGKNTITVNKDNCTFQFNPHSSGYYYIYINNASISYYKNDNYSNKYSLSLESNNDYINNTYYDFTYRIYLYRDNKYTFTTNSEKGKEIIIYIKQ